jgi:hypothetical protein
MSALDRDAAERFLAALDPGDSRFTFQARETPAASGNNLIDMLAAIHEAGHVVFAHINNHPIHDVRIEGQGRGGGEFRTHDGPNRMPLLTGNEAPIRVNASDKERREWCKTLVSFCVPKLAQNKYAGHVGDSMCSHDDAAISRILSSISRSLEDERRMFAQIQEEASKLVDVYWPEILIVARALFEHGRLNKQQIAHLLRVLPTKIAINQTGVDYASSLIAAGKISWGLFTWNDETDGADLLDEEGEDPVSYYHLGYDTEVVGASKYHFPFGKNGEVYAQALVQAAEAGGTIGDYAKKLLGEIAGEKAQSLANTPKPRMMARALPRQPGDPPDFRRRVGDGYLKI